MSDALVLRDNFFPAKNGDPNRGREDLGECVTFAIWADRAAPGEIFFVLSEDVDVVRFCHATRIAYTSEARFMAGRRAVAVTSTDLLGALARQGLITATAAKDVQRSILEQDRPLIGRAQDIV